MKNNLFIIALFFISSMHAQTPNVHFQFNTTFKDTGMNKIQGTPMGNPTFGTDVKGVANSACNFDGIDDYIDLGTTSILKPTSNLTMAFWAYSDNWNGYTNSPTMVGNTEAGGYGIMINNTTQNLEGKVYRKNAFGVVVYPLNKLTTGWHHFGITYVAGTTSLFIDGKIVDSNYIAANPGITYVATNNNTLVGDEASAGTSPEGKKFKGRIDDLRFYNTYLNGTQMQSLYTGTSAAIFSAEVMRKGNLITPNPATNELYLNFEEAPAKPISLNLYNISGQVVSTINIAPQIGLIQLKRPSGIEPGIYQAIIHQNDEVLGRQQIILY